jgi:molecular chaperone HtpG
MTAQDAANESIPFKAETRQLLNILIHSLYSEREVFLRELISNASDALTRMNFEMLTNHNVLDPDAELAIWITSNKDESTLTIRDTGLGMTADEISENLGTIAHSGARAFMQAVESGQNELSNLIGQFGVGFYSAFMVADSIRVTSRTYRKDGAGVDWFSKGEDTFSIEPASIDTRGTTIVIKLKEDAKEFCEISRLREVIKRHSDFIPFPIYLGDDKEQVNQQTALWRKQTREVTQEQAHEFYRQYTLDMNPPLGHIHLNIDAPVQLYALLFIPSTTEKTFFSLRKEDGLKLYARKVLIQEYCRDLLPEYLRFVQGVVDSEDIPLNISRETVQASRVMPQLRRVLTGKVIDFLKDMAVNRLEDYARFWNEFGRFIREGIATDRDNSEALAPLLRFHTLKHPQELASLDSYLSEIKPGQSKIYYILGDDERSIARSPHLDLYRKQGVDVLLLSDPLDSFVLLSLTKYMDHILVSAAVEKPEADATEEPVNEKPEVLPPDQIEALVVRFKHRLGDKVIDVRVTDRLLDSPVRLVDKEGSIQPEMQRVYRMLRQEYEIPGKILELNPSHTLVKRLSDISPTDPRSDLTIDQLYENALLIEGLHPDPAAMIDRIQQLMLSALK